MEINLSLSGKVSLQFFVLFIFLPLKKQTHFFQIQKKSEVNKNKLFLFLYLGIFFLG